MFSNIGKKIQMLAKIVCWGCIGVSIISGFIAFKSSVGYGLGIIIGGVFFSWIGSFIMVGFGKLVETNEEAAQYARLTYEEMIKKQ